MIERRSSPGSSARSSCEMVGEALLSRVQLLEILRRELRRRHLGREPFELGAHHERLVQLVPRDRADAHAAVRHERDEPEGGQAPQRLADGRPRDVELLGKLLLTEDGPGRELARDDRLLDHERDVVCLGGVETSLQTECTPGPSGIRRAPAATPPPGTAPSPPRPPRPPPPRGGPAPRRTGRRAPTATPASARSPPWRRPPSGCRSPLRRRRAATRRDSARRRRRSCAARRR